MAVNLIDQFGRPRAREILESSFAQFQADRAVVGLARQVREQEESLARLREGDDVRPRRLHRVLRHPPRAQRPREAQPQGRERLPGDARTRGSSEIAAPAQADAAASVPSVPRPRASRALGGAVLEAQAHGRQDAPADRDAHRNGRAHLRPRRRRAAGARLRAVADDGATTLTPAGRTMRRIYGERDLLVAESLRTGALEGAGCRIARRRSRAASSTNRAATRPGPGSAVCRAGPSAPR